MDGSGSTLAPVFAAAFATQTSKDAFLVGIAASVGAGISMGFAEAMSDDGVRRLQCAPRTPYSLSVPASIRRSNNGPLQPADDGLGKLLVDALRNHCFATAL
jgi:hypothetical protein